MDRKRSATPPDGTAANRPPGPARSESTSPAIVLAVVIASLAVFIVILYADTLSLSYANDDYLFLDKVRDASFGSLWQPANLVSGYYRPLSREVHFWTLFHLFGANPTPARLVNLALWLGIMTLYFLFVRRVGGTRTAAVATGGLAVLAAWGSPLTWPAGAQDLWMLLFALIFLHAFARGRRVQAIVALGAALLSKETAVVLPALAAFHVVAIERRSFLDAAKRSAGLWGLVLVWALLHPSIGGRPWSPSGPQFTPGAHAPLGWPALFRVLAMLNLDHPFQPDHGWPRAIGFGIAIAAVIAGMVAWVARGPELLTPARRVVAFGMVWWIAAWTPALLPSLGWHSYYGLLGMMGGWLALGVVLARRMVWGVALIAAVAMLRPASTDTFSNDWGTENYERRAAIITGQLESGLRRLHSSFPRHSRIFVANLPGGIGLLAGPGDSPMLRVWYSDSTLRVWPFSQYTKRAPHDTLGRDFFLATDSTFSWVEYHKGPESLDLAHARTAMWLAGANQLAGLFVASEEWDAARVQYEKVSQVDPGYYGSAQNIGVCWLNLGDSERAAFWFERARSIKDSIGVSIMGVRTQ